MFSEVDINPYAKPVFRLICQFSFGHDCQIDTPTDKLPQKRAAHESARFVGMCLYSDYKEFNKRIFKACEVRQAAAY